MCLTVSSHDSVRLRMRGRPATRARVRLVLLVEHRWNGEPGHRMWTQSSIGNNKPLPPQGLNESRNVNFVNLLQSIGPTKSIKDQIVDVWPGFPLVNIRCVKLCSWPGPMTNRCDSILDKRENGNRQAEQETGLQQPRSTCESVRDDCSDNQNQHPYQLGRDARKGKMPIGKRADIAIPEKCKYQPSEQRLLVLPTTFPEQQMYKSPMRQRHR